MLQNYLKTAVRSLLRHRFFSAINIFGLAVAMSICMTLIMLVADQVSYDRYNSNAHRIYRVTTNGIDANGKEVGDHNSCVTMKLKPELMEKYTGVEKAVRIKRGFGNGWLELENQDVNIPLAGFYADPEFFEMFEYEFQYGDPITSLKEPHSVVLTRQAANKLFKDENPVGKTVKVGTQGTFTVTGVLKETNLKSHIVFEGIASMASLKSQLSAEAYRGEMDDWFNNWNGWTYVMLEKEKTPQDIQQHLDKIFKENAATPPNAAKYGDYVMKYSLQPLLTITPGDFMNNSIGPVLPWVFVYFLSGLALVILLTSCFNFTNLSIARSLTRAREIGVRKVSGAARSQIFSQFISESVVVAFVSLALAIVFLMVLKPMILQLSFARFFRWDLYSGLYVYVIFGLLAIAVGIMAGFFPAVVLSAFQPVKVLKSLGNVKLFSRMGLRKVLLVSQFTLSLFFIVTVIVIYNQLNLFTHQDHGFNMKNNIMVKLGDTSHETLKTELQKYTNIVAVSASSHIPAAGTSHGTGVKKKLDDLEPISTGTFDVDEDYLSNMQLKLLAGEFFKAEAGESNKNFVVVNQAMTKKLNFTPQEAIGEQVIFTYDSSRKTIIGVVADYNHRDLTREITPVMLVYRPESFNVLQVSYMGTYDNACQSIEKAWATVNPGLKADYIEVESEINKFYEIVFGDLVRVLGFISFLAIFISCLGLLGMATYATETRIKEISIRKVLGSSGQALVFLLSKGFLKMLGLSIVIGIPLAFFVNNLWLNFIAYRTHIGVGVIALSILILILFGVVTIGSQTIRATFIKPVDNLKGE